jgi:predicted nuclease of predicted toxin-antitoxin system
LIDRGHSAGHVYDSGLGAASDAAIADRAIAEGAILVIKDEDFLLLRLPDRFALLWLRCGNTTNATLGTWLDARWPAVEALLERSERLIELR